MQSNSGAAFTLKALIEEAMGDDDLATADAAQGQNQYNGNEEDPSPATYALAEAYADLGYFAASDKQLDSLLKRHSGVAQASALRGFNEFSIGDTRSAVKDLTTALNGNPHVLQPYMGLSMLEYSQGNLPSAQTYAQRASKLFPHSEYAKLWLLITSGHAPLRPAHLQPCESGFYMGIYALQHGHKRTGDEMLRTAVNACPYREYERAAAQQLLLRM